MKKTIIVSAITTVLVNFLLYLLSGWVIFLMVWIALGFLAKKLVDTHSNGGEEVKYFICFILPPVALFCLFHLDGVSLKDIFGDCLPKFPKFRNPIVWIEKSE